MPTELIVLIISLSGAVILSIIFYQASISFPSPKKKRRQEKAKVNYKYYVSKRRREAWRTYQSYLQQQQRLARQQYVKRIAGQARQLFGEAFPEFQSASNRGAFIRALVLELVGHIYQGHGGLSPEWQNRVRQETNSASGKFEIKRALSEWYLNKKQEIESQYTGEEKDIYLQHLEEIYEEAKMTLDI